MSSLCSYILRLQMPCWRCKTQKTGECHCFCTEDKHKVLWRARPEHHPGRGAFYQLYSWAQFAFVHSRSCRTFVEENVSGQQYGCARTKTVAIINTLFKNDGQHIIIGLTFTLDVSDFIIFMNNNYLKKMQCSVVLFHWWADDGDGCCDTDWGLRFHLGAEGATINTRASGNGLHENENICSYNHCMGEVACDCEYNPENKFILNSKKYSQ